MNTVALPESSIHDGFNLLASKTETFILKPATAQLGLGLGLSFVIRTTEIPFCDN